MSDFKRGDYVRKKGDKGQWRGVVVGEYSTDCTAQGYAVESVLEKNSVQIYPASALELWQPDTLVITREELEKLKRPEFEKSYNGTVVKFNMKERNALIDELIERIKG